jgi:hypothetical protein
MRQILVVLLITLAGRLSLHCQTPAQTSLPPTPQSARQALIEMFVSKEQVTLRNIFRKTLAEP